MNAGEIWQVPDLLGQGAVGPLYNLFKALGICGVGHEANFTTRTSSETWAPGGALGLANLSRLSRLPRRAVGRAVDC